MRNQRLKWITAALLLIPGLAVAGTTSVIVELDSPPAVQAVVEARQLGVEMPREQLARLRGMLRDEQDRVLQSMRRQGLDIELNRLQIPDGEGGTVAIEVRYTLVYNGFNLHVDQRDVAALKRVAGVKAVHRDLPLYPQLQGSVDYIRAPALYGDVEELSPGDDANEGLEGQGTTIAVIDTGIDWTHPMFGGDPTPPRLGILPEPPAGTANAKVIYNLPMGEIVHDGYGHGSHVASTAAGYLAHAPGADRIPGTDDDVPLHGVAPQARLMSYKVCNDINSTLAALAGVGFGCFNAVTTLALEDAMSPVTQTGFDKPIPDVINLSLGGAGGPDSPTAVASSNAVRLGAIVVSSAGNAGPGEGTVGSPAAGEFVIAVGANADPGDGPNSVDVLSPDGSEVIDDRDILAAFASESNLTMRISEPVQGNYVFAGLADTPDQVPLAVAGNICLTVRGSTVDAGAAGTGLFANKALQCQLKGAIAVLVYNNEPGPLGNVLAPSTIPVFTVSDVDGEYINGLGYDDNGVSLHPIRINPEDPALFQPLMAGFSSRGPVQGFGQVKPDVTAPGVSVLAAVPPASVIAALGGGGHYAAIQGTSMSSPHVAGTAALLRQAHPDWTPSMVRTALINAATNLRQRDGAPEADGVQTVLDQGGGLVDAEAASGIRALMGVAGDGEASPEILGSHSFGSLPVLGKQCAQSRSVDVVIRDLSGQAAEYAVSVVPNRNDLGDGAALTLDATSVSVPAGGQAGFAATLTLDGRAEPAEPGAAQVMGYIVAESDTQRLRMPWYARAVPFAQDSVTETLTGTVLVGDANLELAEGVDYTEVSFEVGEDTVQINASLTWDYLVDGTYPDLELRLFDPEGNEIASAVSAANPEMLSAVPTVPGTYIYRVVGYLAANTSFEITSEQVKAGSGEDAECRAAGAPDAPERTVVNTRGGAPGPWLLILPLAWGLWRRRR